MMRRMLRSPTYWTSGPDDSNVTDRVSHRRDGTRTKRRAHFAFQASDQALVLHIVHEIQHDLDSRQDNRTVSMLQTNADSLGQRLGVKCRLRDEGE